MLDALIAGRLLGTPQARTAKNGRPFVTARVRTPTRDGETLLVNVVAFHASVIEALAALEDGEAVALAGELTVGTWTADDGTVRPSLSLTAHGVLSEYHVQRKRHAVAIRNRKVEDVTRQGDASD